MITEILQRNGEISTDKDFEDFIRKNNEIANDFVENYLEPFLLSLEDDPTIAEEIKRQHFAHGASISYIDEDRLDVITVEYPDGRKEFLPLHKEEKWFLKTLKPTSVQYVVSGKGWKDPVSKYASFEDRNFKHVERR